MKHIGIVLAAAGLLAGGVARAACVLKPLAELPVTMSANRQPRLSATVNGVPISFMVDSGAFFSSLSSDNAATLKLRLVKMPDQYVIGVGGVADISQTRVASFGLAGAMLHDVEFAVVHSGVADLIGQNVLGLADTEYDLGAGMVRLMRPSDCGDRPLSYWAPGVRPSSATLIHVDEGQYSRAAITVFVDGTPLRALLDTGAGASVITAKAASRLGLKSEDGPEGSMGGVGRRTVGAAVAKIDDLKLGDEEIKNTRLVIIEDPLVMSGVEMILGADFFLSHHVYVAASQSKVYFTYSGGPVFAPPQGGGVADANQSPLKDAASYARRGAASESRGEQRQAIDDYDRAVAMTPDDPDLLDQRATAYARAGKVREALDDLDKSLRLKPAQPAVLVERAAMRRQSHDDAGALVDLRAADAAVGDSDDLHLAIATGFSGLDRQDDMVTQLDLWIANHAASPRVPEALNARCWARALANQALEKALADCNAAVRSDPRNFAYLDSRALVFLRLGQTGKSIADYDASLAARPNGVWSLYGRGLAKIQAGDGASGKSDLAQAVAIDPGIAARAGKYGLTP